VIGRNALVRIHRRSLGVFLSVVAIGGVVSLAAMLGPSYVSATAGNVGALAVLISLAWAGYSVTCPECDLRLLHHAMKTQPASRWLHWVLNASECPKCCFREALRQ
jgi:hypothetical protein